MKIAVSSKGQGLDAQLDPRFGRTDFFLIIDVDSGKILKVIDNTASQDAAHGAGINAATIVAEAGAEMVLTGHIGPKAFGVLNAAGIKVISDASGTVREAVEHFKQGGFKEVSGPDTDVHQGIAAGQGLRQCQGARPQGGGRGRGGRGR
jgi:predicted Fe-Mo cluster-binding NifX family protein